MYYLLVDIFIYGTIKESGSLVKETCCLPYLKITNKNVSF